ncbi:MAG: heavy metal-associated domain-containing protein [Sporomusaceae bacterium]|nr:heavy metal-associated domain-containing protein [Sporomusaceae bacterium]
MNTTEIIRVGGMTCGNCQKAVEGAVLALEGVSSAVVSLTEERLTVQFDQTKLSLAAIKTAVEDIGFDIIE